MDWFGELNKERDNHNKRLSESPKAYHSRFENTNCTLPLIKKATLGYALLWGEWYFKYKPDDIRKWDLRFDTRCHLKHDGDRKFYINRKSPVHAIHIRLVNSRRYMLCPKRLEFFSPKQFKSLNRQELPTLSQYVDWGRTYLDYHVKLGAQIERNVVKTSVHLQKDYDVDGDKARSLAENFVRQVMDDLELDEYKQIEIKNYFDELEDFLEGKGVKHDRQTVSL